MKLEKIEILPRILPEKTLLFIRSLEYKYAKAFIERGSMRFAKPSEWVPDGTSRGDSLEGVYASQRGYNAELDGFLRSLRKKPFSVKNGKFTFYKSKEIISYRAHCLYGLNSNNMHLQERRSQDHQYHRVGKVDKDYFEKLFPKVKRGDVELLEKDERPTVLIIRPDVFVSHLKTKLVEMGIKDKEIFVKPICYIDYYRKPFIIGKEPEELFTKHNIFKEQNEIRVVIDTRRKEVQELFDKTNGVIEIGPIDKSIATLSEFYFDDMLVEERGDHLLYSKAKPDEFPLDEVDDQSFIDFLSQALADELPGAPMSIEKIEEELEKCLGYLRSRDKEAKYYKLQTILYYKGKLYNLAEKAAICMLHHYLIYIKDGDVKSAGETIEKIHHFFPMYNFEHFFKDYYD